MSSDDVAKSKRSARDLSLKKSAFRSLGFSDSKRRERELEQAELGASGPVRNHSGSDNEPERGAEKRGNFFRRAAAPSQQDNALPDGQVAKKLEDDVLRLGSQRNVTPSRSSDLDIEVPDPPVSVPVRPEVGFVEEVSTKKSPRTDSPRDTVVVVEIFGGTHGKFLAGSTTTFRSLFDRVCSKHSLDPLICEMTLDDSPVSLDALVLKMDGLAAVGKIGLRRVTNDVGAGLEEKSASWTQTLSAIESSKHSRKGSVAARAEKFSFLRTPSGCELGFADVPILVARPDEQAKKAVDTPKKHVDQASLRLKLSVGAKMTHKKQPSGGTTVGVVVKEVQLSDHAAIDDLGNVLIKADVLRVKVLDVDAKLPADLQLYVVFGWVLNGDMPSKREKLLELRTTAKGKPWHYFGDSPCVLELPKDRTAQNFFVELWSFHRVQDKLEAAMDLSLEQLHEYLVEMEVKREKVLSLHSEKTQEVRAFVRVALEMGRSDERILRNVTEGIKRLAQVAPGESHKTELWPQVEGGVKSHTSGVRRSLLAQKKAPLTAKDVMMSALTDSRQAARGFKLGVARKKITDGVDSSSSLFDSSASNVGSSLLDSSAVLEKEDDKNSDDDIDKVFEGYSSAREAYSNAAQPDGHYENPDGSSSSSDLDVTGFASKPNTKSGIVNNPGDLKFNDDWQVAIEKLASNESQETFEVLSSLSKKFVAIAQTYGRIIVRELHFPVERKTIRPMDLGGVIGGDKYVIGGILFKVARSGFFDDEEPAHKVAGHELKALTALFNVTMSARIALALPMIAILDVLGHRLIALALCPINSSTLVMGSCDAGVTIHSNLEAEDKLKVAAKYLNLSEHYVKGCCCPLAVDTEVHKGTDGRLYAIDLSRVLPPQKPERSFPLGHLYRMLRPELVRTNPVALSSDAGSNFVAGESDAKDQLRAISEATVRLRTSIIPLAAASLDQFHYGSSWEYFSLEHMHQCLHVLHAQGVNHRFLMEVKWLAQQRTTMQLLMIECVARQVKKTLRRVLRKTLALAEYGCYDVAVGENVVSFLNSLFTEQQNEEGNSVWERLAIDLQLYFGPVERERAVTGDDLRELVLDCPLGPVLVFSRLNEMLGLQWSSRVNRLVDASFEWLMKQQLLDNASGARNVVVQITSQAFRGLKGAKNLLKKQRAGGSASEDEAKRQTISTNDSETKLSLSSKPSALIVQPRPDARKSPNSSEPSSPRPSEPSSPRPKDVSSPRPVDGSVASAPLVSSSALGGASAALKDNVRDLSSSQLVLLDDSPWAKWAAQSVCLFFADDLLDVGFRVKLNNVSAMAQGRKLTGMSHNSNDVDLKKYFRDLACSYFKGALMSNPSNPVTLRLYAGLLLDQELLKLGAKGSLPAGSFWNSHFRYVDFLFKIALDSSPNDSVTLLEYARFIALSKEDLCKRAFLLVRAVCADHFNDAAFNELTSALLQLNCVREVELLEVWQRGRT